MVWDYTYGETLVTEEGRVVRNSPERDTCRKCLRLERERDMWRKIAIEHEKELTRMQCRLSGVE